MPMVALFLKQSIQQLSASWSDGDAPIMAIRCRDVKYIHVAFDLGIDSHLYAAASKSGYLWIRAVQVSDDVVRTDWSNIRVQAVPLEAIAADCAAASSFPE
jgi:hypothetical protein